ncbi:MAG: xanthine dehydrogenase family protein subunit M [Alphaproteobacteria bacterium]|nr:xanthine dehydrogenase family protein subunit M [Alphaproteobacteria bacterium]
MSECRYTRARRVDEAVAALAEAKGDAHVIAGGIALGILMNEKLVSPTWLVDISRIEALKGIVRGPDGTLRIGALTTHREVEESPAVAAAQPMLPEMAAEIACGRIKNRGTFGGNLSLADPQGDPPVAVIALRATMRAAGPLGVRDIPATEFFRDLYTTALREGELLQEVLFPPLAPGAGTAYGKFAARRAMDYTSTVAVGVRAVVEPATGCIKDIGLGLGGVGPIPVWARATEAALRGMRPEPAVIDRACDVLVDEIEPLADHLYSADFKRHVATVILRRTLARACARAARGVEARR